MNFVTEEPAAKRAPYIPDTEPVSPPVAFLTHDAANQIPPPTVNQLPQHNPGFPSIWPLYQHPYFGPCHLPLLHPISQANLNPIAPGQLNALPSYTPSELANLNQFDNHLNHFFSFAPPPSVVRAESDGHILSENDIIVGLSDTYTVGQFLGKGSFGQVYHVYTNKKQNFAVKLFTNYSEGELEREIVQKLARSKYVVHFIASFIHKSHLCLLYEKLDVSLYEFIKASGFKGIMVPKLADFAIQMVEALAFLARMKIIHTDIKLENIMLVAPNSHKIKLIDLGNACTASNVIAEPNTQTMIIRAPEIILGYSFGEEIDMWSVGCCLVELCVGRGFYTSQYEYEHLNQIIKTHGISESMIRSGVYAHKFFQETTEGEYRLKVK